MNIVAIVPPGQKEITVNGLHQWDYGRLLEIHIADLPTMIEVHFACAGMKEAVARSCESTTGVYTAAIPDRCLEQTAPIVAWVYVIDDTVGSTVLTITMPVERRARPASTPSVPETVTDKYTEAIAGINAAVEAVEQACEANIEAMNNVLETGVAHHALHADVLTPTWVEERQGDFSEAITEPGVYGVCFQYENAGSPLALSAVAVIPQPKVTTTIAAFWDMDGSDAGENMHLYTMYSSLSGNICVYSSRLQDVLTGEFKVYKLASLS